MSDRSIARIRFAVVLGFGLVLNTVWFCGGALVALAVVATCELSLGEALAVTGLVWFAAQTEGFACFHYPQDALTIGWGAALGLAALLATAVASLVRARIRASSLAVRAGRAGGAFALAFVSYEAALFAFSRTVAHGDGFAAAVVAEVLRTNVVAAAALGLATSLTLRAVATRRTVA